MDEEYEYEEQNTQTKKRSCYERLTCIDYFEGECIMACSDDRECTKGKYCHYDEKVCLDPCKAHEECVDGYVCSFSKGMKRCVKNCECNSECGSGQYCK